MEDDAKRQAAVGKDVEAVVAEAEQLIAAGGLAMKQGGSGLLRTPPQVRRALSDAKHRFHWYQDMQRV